VEENGARRPLKKNPKRRVRGRKEKEEETFA
jgi:hypothetical protein